MRTRSILLISLVVPLAILAAAVGYTADLLPGLASREGAPIDGLLRVTFALAAAIATPVLLVLGYSLLAFRRRPGEFEDGRPIRGNTRLEVSWTLVPLAVVLALGVYAQLVWQDITTAGGEELAVDVTAFQFGWRFHYPAYGITSGELVLPRGRTALLRLSSRDVIHSLWVREFRVKMDAVPGMQTELRMTPSEIGQFEVWCAELCGLAHAYMRAAARVVEPAEFAAWAAAQPRG